MDYENYLLEGMHLGLDNYITASFWLNSSTELQGRFWKADAFYHIITNRSAGYRVDLLACGLSTSEKIPQGDVLLGAGVLTSGDYGGDTIQNNYHDVAGVLSLHLPYAYQTRVGAYFTLKYHLPRWKYSSLEFATFVSNMNSLLVGLNSSKVGLNIKTQEFSLLKHFRIATSALVCYSWYHHLSEELSPIFESGICYGGELNLKVWRQFTVSTWFLSNQYRNDQGHCGVAFTYGGGNLPPPGLDAVLFP
jgi:hypothetical protein